MGVYDLSNYIHQISGAYPEKTYLNLMIGIDIVDLNDPLLRKRTERSLGLISNEQDKSINHPQLFWLFWSAKEAVFKTNREERSFAPKEIPISLSLEDSKIVFTSDGINGEILVEKDYILSIAGENPSSFNHLIVNDDAENWSNTIREKITGHFSEKGISTTVSKSGSLPVLNDRHPISITHHGEFAAFVYPRSFLNS